MAKTPIEINEMIKHSQIVYDSFNCNKAVLTAIALQFPR